MRVKNITVDYFYRFVSNFNLTGAVWVLYLSYKGMSLVEIGLLEGIFHVTSLLFEIPTGAMADLLGRKRVVMLGRLLALIQAGVMVFSNDFWMFALAFVLSAASYNLNSGSEEALIFDSLKEAGKDGDYLRVNGRLNFIIEVAQGLSSFVGGILAEVSFALTYGLEMGKNGLSLLVASSFKEPNYRETEKRLSVKEHFSTSIRIIKENKGVRKLLLFYPVIFSFQTLAIFYGQQHFSNMGMRKPLIALLMLISGVVCSLAALAAHGFDKHLKDKGKYVAAAGVAISLFFFGVNQWEIAILAFMTMNYCNSLMYPIASNALNQLIPSEQRATIISVDSMVFSIAMIILFPLSGLLGDIIGLSLVFHGLAVFMIAYIMLFWIFESHK